MSMKYTIGQVNINLDFYSGIDLYSDGDIETELLEIVKSHADYSQIIRNDGRWPILYHLSPQRRNLLEWYNFGEKSKILEIGAGCGALTGLFCEKAQSVSVIELSKKRAEIIAQRHKDKSNLEIFVGNFKDVKINEKYDYIVLIGVLEYASKYIDSERPFSDFLCSVQSLLKDDGTLIIAIENKFGLKYWAGANEDHSGRLFDSIEGYIGNNDIETFSKKELNDLLIGAAYDDIRFYYPLPDYKLPTQIFSDRKLPSIGQIGESFPNYDQERFALFKEKVVFNNLIESDMFDVFSNSFLVFCRKKGIYE